MTTAERISKRFRGDAFTWFDLEGNHLADVCRTESDRVFSETGARFGFRRFEFGDASAIVVGLTTWAIGLSGLGIDCTCSRNPELIHRDGCRSVSGQQGMKF